MTSGRERGERSGARAAVSRLCPAAGPKVHPSNVGRPGDVIALAPNILSFRHRGFYKRILNDPSMKHMSVSAFVTLVKKVFPAPERHGHPQMKRAALVLLLASCAAPGPPPRAGASAGERGDASASQPEPMPMPTPDTDHDEVDAQIQRLLAPSGDAAYRQTRGEALQWLLAHAAEAYPKLRAIVDAAGPPPLAISALAQFQRADSVPLLTRVLHEGDDPTTVVAASALADVHAPEALAALERALGDGRDQVVASAADALAQRGDRAACSSLVSAEAHPNEEVRARVRSAVERLGCTRPR